MTDLPIPLKIILWLALMPTVICMGLARAVQEWWRMLKEEFPV
jgi:hypothetical protein